MIISGTALLNGGQLEVILIDLGGGVYQPGAGDSFGFLSASGGFDMFGSQVLPPLEPGLEWQLNPGGITMSLNVTISLPGDYNQDNVVDGADYTVWRDSLGDFVVPGSYADGNGDGVVSALDYSIWKTNFGNTNPGASANTAVPEPATMLLMLLAILGSHYHRQRITR